MAVFLGNYESGSDEWLALRSGPGVVTGTLAGTIAGLNPWESAFTAWAKATGKIPNEVRKSRPMRLGQLLEAPIVQLWSEENPDYKIDTDLGTWSHPDNEWARANPDGFLTYPDGTAGILEIKTARVPFEEVPLHYKAQVLWYMWVFGIQKAKLVALFGGNDIQTFEIVWDEFAAQANAEMVARWWACVESGEQPEWDGSTATYEVVRELHPDIDPDGVVDLGQLGIELTLAQQEFDKVESHLRELKSRTLDYMG